MIKAANSLTELIGNTPLLKLNSVSKHLNLSANIFAKLEYFNPQGSVKDRAALYLIENAEKKGFINKDTLIIEPTSGNTGIGLAFVCATKGYKLILTMPETMSIERRNLLKALGAELVLTDGKLGMKGAIAKANELKEQNENAYIPQQFENEANPLAHKETTALEILKDTDGNVDFFVAGVGTGGTVSGCGEVLKEKIPNIKIVAVEPKESAVISGEPAGPHKIQGIGAGFIPKNLNVSILDEVIQIPSEDAMNACKLLSKHEGLLVGVSSGAAFASAVEIAKRPENEGKNIVVIFPDTGERYLSTGLF